MSQTAAMALVGLLVVAGSLFLAAAGWIIWRVECQGEANALRVADMVHEVQAVLRVMRHGAEAMVEHAQRQQVAARAVASGFSSGQLEQLRDVLASLAPRHEDRDRAGAGAREETSAELKRALVARGQLEGELETLRMQLNDQLRQLSEQRHDAQAAASALNNSTALREVNEQLIQELRDTRRRNQKLETDLGPVMTELQVLRAQLEELLRAPSLAAGNDLDAAMASAAERASEVHLARVAELEAELNKARDESMKVKDELSRTLREKSFIEDEYLSMADREAAASATAVAEAEAASA